MTNGLLTYSANNSGGSWWLSHQDYLALEKAGWIVHWVHDISQEHPGFEGGGKNDPHTWTDHGYARHSHYYGDAREVTAIPDGSEWLGTTAVGASKRFHSAEQGVEEWERITGQLASEEGCNCCGSPHSFEWQGDDGNYRHSSVEVTRTELSWW